MNVEIRDTTRGDAPAIAELFHDTVLNIDVRDYSGAQVEAWAGPAPEKWEERIAVDDARRTFVAVEDGVSRS